MLKLLTHSLPTASALRLTALAALLTLSGGAEDLFSATVESERGEPTGSCAASLGRLQPMQGAELDGELDILSWNIQKAGNEGWAEDLASFASGVHLAFIQEASLEAAIHDALDDPLFPAFARGYSSADQQTGVMTLSAGLPSMRCSFTAWEPWLGTPKATSVTEHPLKGRSERLLTINLHAVNFSVGTEEFQAQFEALDQLLRDHSGPVIFAGDLNTWSESRESVVREFLAGHGLNAVQFMPDLRTTAFGRALDHIFVRGLEASEAWVIPVQSSDHNALRARLRLQGEES